MRFIAKITATGLTIAHVVYDHKDGFNASHSARKGKESLLRSYDSRARAGFVGEIGRDVAKTVGNLFEVFIASSIDANGRYVGNPQSPVSTSYNSQGHKITYEFQALSQAQAHAANKRIDDEINAVLEQRGIVLPVQLAAVE